MYKLKTIREVVKICFANVFPEISLMKYEKITVCFLFYFSFINVWIQLSPFSHHHSPPLTHPHLLYSILPFLGFVHGSFRFVGWRPFPFFPHLVTCLPNPHCLMSVCSLFQCLWLYFVCFFLLLIMFHLKVRSYGICPSLPGLFHLA